MALPRVKPCMEHRNATKTQGYATVNGLRMYYEIEGSGSPLVYIHPILAFAGMSTFPELTQRHTVISLDLQGHGRTADIRERPLSIEQFASDVVALLKHLGISKADFFGESYGAAVATLIASRHSELVGRVATYGGKFGPSEDALDPAMFRFTHPPHADSMSHSFQRDRYKEVAPDPAYWPALWDKVMALRWEGFSREELAAITVPLLIAVGDHDFIRVEHAVDTFRRVPGAELAIIPDAGHFLLFSEAHKVIPIVQDFLEKPAKRIPIGTAEMGFHPGETR